VVDSRNISPVDWHVPSDAEWKQLEMYLGMSLSDANADHIRGTDEGGKLKEKGTTHWNSPNTGATNESRFSALPGGFRVYHGDFYDIGSIGHWWSTTENDSSSSWYRTLVDYSAGVGRLSYYKTIGFSVRCVRTE
jgi:uncharacterized protein (TIGR02145 family)